VDEFAFGIGVKAFANWCYGQCHSDRGRV
jgi:hypothetical protein